MLMHEDVNDMKFETGIVILSVSLLKRPDRKTCDTYTAIMCCFKVFEEL